jgi:peptidyl-prolyl cis-trans isomerase B (cyclophilin B)
MKKIISLIAVLTLALCALCSCKEDYTYVQMEFEGYGSIVLKIDNKTAPKTAENFVKLVEDGFYDGLLMNRAQAGFVIQGGSPSATSKEPDTIVGEFSSNGYDNDIEHVKGVISMARSNDPDSAASTFFICIGDARRSLDGKYAGFGEVVEGMDVVDDVADALIAAAALENNYYAYYMGFVSNPDNCVVIKSAKVLSDYKE